MARGQARRCRGQPLLTVVADEDLYALLQVSSTATDEEIAAAYAHLDALYTPERLRDGPPEFQQLALQRREELRAAYLVLGDPERRVAYDHSRASARAPEALDFSPLPPARRRERPSPSIALPSLGERTALRQAGQGRRARSIVPPLLVGATMLGILLFIVLSGVRVQSGAAALSTPAIPDLQLPYTEAQVEDARDRATNAKDPAAWVTLGDMLYDNMQTVRERAPLSPQYLGALPQWLAAADAYRRGLELGAGPAARADLAIALFAYSVGAGDAATMESAVEESQQAFADGPDDPRVLLNYGLIMAEAQPPRAAEAQAAWQRLLRIAPQSPEAQRAAQLLAAYGPPS